MGYKLTGMYIGQQKIRPSPGRQPGVNTLVYLTLDGNITDTSGNGRDGTLNFSSYTYEYLNGNSGQQFIKMVGSNSMNDCISGTYSSTALGSGDRTVSCWLKFFTLKSDIDTGVSPFYLGALNGGTNGGWFGMYNFAADSGQNKQIGILRYYSDPQNQNYSDYDYNWHNYIITYNDTNKGKMYVDGQQITMTSDANSSFNTNNTAYQLGPIRASIAGVTIGYSSFIIEDKAWTDQEIADYYDLTKGDYGIS